jgi:anti-anti-sigma factor
MNDLATVETTIRDDGNLLVRVAGEIDLSNAATVMEAVATALPGDAVTVVVDLSGTSFLDSAGIAMLFRLAERLAHSRQRLCLVVPPDAPIRRVVELTNLHRAVEVRPLLEAAGGRG